MRVAQATKKQEVRQGSGPCLVAGSFAILATRSSKTQLNFLDLLRAGHTDYVLNQAALGYLRSRGLPGPLIARLAETDETHFMDHAAWQAHLTLGIVSPAKAGFRMAFCRTPWC